MKFNSKGEFEVKYSFFKPRFQNFEVITPLVGVINPKMVKRSQLVFQLPMFIESQKSKVKGTLRCIIHL